MNGETKGPNWRKAETGIHQAESEAAKREAFAHMELLKLEKEHRKRKIGERVKRIILSLLFCALLALAFHACNQAAYGVYVSGGNCQKCQGIGCTWEKCVWCSGTGRTMTGRLCLHCNGTGVKVKKCWTCRGTGREKISFAF
jgi:hypothetical protein